MSRQLGLGLATIGLAGLLVSALPSMQLGLGASSAAAPAARPAAGAAVDGSASGGGETSTDTNSASGGLVGITGDGASPAPGRLAVVPGSSAAASALAAGPQAVQSSPPGFGAYKDSSATPGTVAGPIVPSANPTDERALNGAASQPHAFGEPSVQSDGGRGLLLAGSLVLLWAGIALLVIRQLVRRSIQH